MHRGAHETFDESADLRHAGAHADLCRVRGREVDPRHAGHAGAARDAERHRARLPDRHLPRLLSHDSGLPVTWRVGLAGGSRGGHAAARGARRARRGRRRQSARRADRPRAARPDAPRGLQAAAEQGITGRDVTPFLLERFHSRPTGRACARTSGSSCATPRWPRRSPPRCDLRPRRYQRGRRHGARRADRAAQRHHARITLRPGGGGANVAAWLAKAGADVTLIGRVGDDVLAEVALQGLDGVNLHVTRDPSAPPARASCSSRPAASGRCCRTRVPTTRSAAADLPELDGEILHVSGYALLRPGSRPRRWRRSTARARGG